MAGMLARFLRTVPAPFSLIRSEVCSAMWPMCSPWTCYLIRSVPPSFSPSRGVLARGSGSFSGTDTLPMPSSSLRRPSVALSSPIEQLVEEANVQFSNCRRIRFCLSSSLPGGMKNLLHCPSPFFSSWCLFILCFLSSFARFCFCWRFSRWFRYFSFVWWHLLLLLKLYFCYFHYAWFRFFSFVWFTVYC